MGKYREHRSSRRGHGEDLFSHLRQAGRTILFPAYSKQGVATACRGGDVVQRRQRFWLRQSQRRDRGLPPYPHVGSWGTNSVSEGMQLKVRINEGPKGLQVSQVLEVSAATEQTAPEKRQAFQSSAGADVYAREEERHWHGEVVQTR